MARARSSNRSRTSSRARKARPARTVPSGQRAKAGAAARTRRPALSRPSRRRAGAATAPDQRATALRPEAGDERSGRAGDRVPFRETQERFPPRRVREAGLTGGETPERDRVTADDASPETLLDDEGGRNPADQRGPRASDAMLSVVDESAIGAGGGRDEAEDARQEPISPQEHARLKRRIARAGGSVANLEPNETRAGNPGRDRNARR